VKVIYQEGFEPIEFSSRIKPETRKKILQAFEEGGNKNTFLVAVKCLDEGIDIPACDSAILVSCSRSVREFVQRRGRLLRKHPTKDFSTIHDIVILPFANKEEAYPLTLSEFGFIKEELRRVEILSGNAENSKDFNVDNQIQLYRRYVLG
jgi:superfamily II DNA or RNA helicase